MSRNGDQGAKKSVLDFGCVGGDFVIVPQTKRVKNQPNKHKTQP